MSVICNTTVLSNFAAIGQLSLLRALYRQIFIPLGVYEEIRQALDEGYGFYQTVVNALYPQTPDGWIHLTSLTGEAELNELVSMLGGIHRGEAECLAIARHRRLLLLTDDRRARALAIERGIELSGSLGSLKLAVENRLCALDDGNRFLSLMIGQGYWTTIRDLADLA